MAAGYLIDWVFVATLFFSLKDKTMMGIAATIGCLLPHYLCSRCMSLSAASDCLQDF